MDEEKVSNKNTKIKFSILAIVCIILFSFAIAPVTLQNDTFYTIKIGEDIVANGIDMQDHYSWNEDLPYTYPHWLYDTGIYLIYNFGASMGIENGGMLFIYLFTAMLSAVLGVLVYITLKKICKNELISFLLTLGVVYLMRDFIAARAQLVTFILFILTILFIESFIESNKKRYLVGIVLISIIIANVHVAVWPFFFVLFLPYIAEYIIAILLKANILSRFLVFVKKDKIKNLERKLTKETNEEKKNKLIEKLEEAKKQLELTEQKVAKMDEKAEKRRQNPYKLKIEYKKCVKWLVLVMAICALTGLLTPIGDAPYTYLVKTMQGNTTKSISEHLPLTLFDNVDAMIVLALIFAILIFTDTKMKLRDFFMVGGLIFLTFMSRRQMSLLALVGAGIVAKWLNYLADKYDKEGSMKLMKLMVTVIGKILTIGIVIILSLFFIKPKINDKFINTSKYPVDASTWILENLDINNIKLYNEYNYGSYLLFRGIPVFIDSRADLYAPEFNKTEEYPEGRNIFSDYINISSIGTYYETKFDEYDITHVILVNNSKLNMFISRNEDYKQLYKDDNFVIYERKSK